MKQMMDYRFQEGTLAGQSFGNLFLAALNGISPNFDTAVPGPQDDHIRLVNSGQGLRQSLGCAW